MIQSASVASTNDGCTSWILCYKEPHAETNKERRQNKEMIGPFAFEREGQDQSKKGRSGSRTKRELESRRKQRKREVKESKRRTNLDRRKEKSMDSKDLLRHLNRFCIACN